MVPKVMIELYIVNPSSAKNSYPHQS